MKELVKIRKIFEKVPCLLMVTGFLLLFMQGAQADVRLPNLVSDGMVLQRNTEIKIWGWADPGEKITLRFQDKTHRIMADKQGEWSVKLSPMKAGGPYKMEIEGRNHITIDNILIGEVWISSGQSNMELPVRRVRPLYEQEIATSKNRYIRYFDVPDRYNFQYPMEKLESGSWKETNPESVLNFSAAAYFFARELYKKYAIPVGIINASLGGSPAQAWISEDALKKSFPAYYREAQKFKDSTLISQIQQEDRQRINRWYTLLNKKDYAYQSPVPWDEPEVNTEKWSAMKVPGYWAETELGNINGAVWFRKIIHITEEMAGKAAKLNMGRIVDADSTFINGKFVGNTTYQYPPRWYEVPKGLIKEGKNVIVVRVVNVRGKGGFVLDKPYKLTIPSDTIINLKGLWKYRLGATMKSLEPQTFIRWKPVGLFNGMTAPLLDYRIKGVIWYQGESNTDKPHEYRELFSLLIRNWRDKWNQGDFPFLFVQLANYMEPVKEPVESNWAALREAQRETLSLPNTAMAVTIDIGEWNDIHPLNKKEVGHRLALAAQKVAYHEDIVYSGPMIKSMKVKENKAILSFTHIGSGLVAKGGEPGGFAIAGSDRNFVWASARIEGDKVIAWSDKVKNPVVVRYGWADNPVNANLYNKEGLPASPFEIKKSGFAVTKSGKKRGTPGEVQPE